MVKPFDSISGFPFRMHGKEEMEPNFINFFGDDEYDEPYTCISGYADLHRLLGIKYYEPQERDFKVIRKKDKQKAFVRFKKHKLADEAPEEEEKKR